MRCWFILAVVIWLVTCPSVVSSFIENPNTSNTVTISSMGPVVSGTNQNSTVISIVAVSDCIPVIRYVNDSYFSISQDYDHEISSSSNGRNHSIRITDLEPATKYHYQVSGCGVQDIDRMFSTFPVTGSCRFIVYGDTREQVPLYTQTERHKLVADRIAQEQNVLFVVNSGDLVSDSGDPGEWSRFFNATDKLRSMTTYRAVPGNHDTNRSLFRQLFEIDNTTFFDCGNARIALLDSTDMSAMTMRDQAEWIKSVFVSYTGAKIVILHHPVFCSEEKHYGGFEDLQQILVPALKVSRINLVFNSHVHAFEQVKRNSITYITEGRGGAPAYPLNTTRIPGSVKTVENTLGYSRVTVDPGAREIRIEVIRVADVSTDLRTVTKVYPLDTVDTKIRVLLRNTFVGFPEISELCFHQEDEGINGCQNPLISLNKLPI
jgi:Calcineurin-like phosphoesterase